MRASSCLGIAGSIILVGLAAQAANADLEAFVASGDRVTGDLRAGGETDSYRLAGASGDIVEALVHSNRSVTVRLLDSGGGVLASGSGKNVHLVSSALSAAGQVTVEISSSSSSSGKARYTAMVTSGDETSDRKLDLREATIGAHTTSVEADEIGRDGGTLAAESVSGIGSAAAVFAPDFLHRTKSFVIGATADLSPAGLTAVGPAVLFGPLPQTFGARSGVQIVLPYDPSSVSLAPQVIVAGLDGSTSVVKNVTIDAANSVVRFTASRFGIFQVFDGTSAIGPLSGAELTNSDVAAYDQMASVATSGSRIVVGVPLHADGAGSGAAYVYELSGSTWSEVAKLQPSDTTNVGWFGTSVSIDGDRIAVSSGAQYPGVWIFDRVGGTWTESASIAGEGFQFGTDISLQGNRLAVSAPMFRSSIFVYDFDGTNWNKSATISPGPSGLGTSLSLDGDRLAMSLMSPPYGGVVYSYVKSGSQWIEEDQITPEGGNGYDLFGSDVALQGTTMIVGARNERGHAGYVGAAYVFELVNGIWTQKARVDNPNGAADDHFGASVALDGDRAMIGAPMSRLVATEGGASYLVQRGSGNWTSIQAIVPSGIGVGDHFGNALAIAGTTAVVLAPGEDDGATNAGVVHVLDLTGR